MPFNYQDLAKRRLATRAAKKRAYFKSRQVGIKPSGSTSTSSTTSATPNGPGVPATPATPGNDRAKMVADINARRRAYIAAQREKKRQMFLSRRPQGTTPSGTTPATPATPANPVTNTPATSATPAIPGSDAAKQAANANRAKFIANRQAQVYAHRAEQRKQQMDKWRASRTGS